MIDRVAQRVGSYTGIKSVPAQDWAVQEYQGGPILDRSLERLVSADASIIAVRQRILKTVRALQEGTEPDEPATLAVTRAADRHHPRQQARGLGRRKGLPGSARLVRDHARGGQSSSARLPRPVTFCRKRPFL